VKFCDKLLPMIYHILKRPMGVLLILLAGSLALVACKSKETPGPTATPTFDVRTPLATTARPTFTPTPLPTDTPTPEPLGSPANPIIVGLLMPQNDPLIIGDGDQLASQLSQSTGYTVQAKTFDSYPAILAAIETGNVHVTWLPPFTYILAHQQGLVDAALMTNHFGIYSYGTMFLANIESGFTPFFDPNTNQNTADAGPALRQFNGKLPCWVEAKSASGYIIPMGLFAMENISFQQPVLIQSFDSVVRALYVHQICDFGATYAISGDPRTASSIQDAFPDVMQKVIVIWRSDAVIPNLGMVYKSDFPKALRQLLTDALIQWVNTDAGKTALTNANQYNIGDLKEIDDTYYDPLRTYLQASAVDLNSLVGR
jgi:phosphonate transport system substrate-binding protein